VPDLIRAVRYDELLALSLRLAPSGSTGLIETHVTVHPMYPLVISGEAQFPHAFETIPEAAPRMLLEIVVDAVDHRAILRWPIPGQRLRPDSLKSPKFDRP
jgi:hypothetical protein